MGWILTGFSDRKFAHRYRFWCGFGVAASPPYRKKCVVRNSDQYPCLYSTCLFCFDGDPCFEFRKVVNGYVAMLTIPPPALSFKGFKRMAILGKSSSWKGLWKQ